MILFLRGLFIVVLVSMLLITGWAGGRESLMHIPAGVTHDPWFIATLFDAYWGFVTFYVWLAWKEGSGVARVLWFIDVIALGNLAMSTYLLIQLFRVPSTGSVEAVITTRNPGRWPVPAALAVVSVAVYAFA